MSQPLDDSSQRADWLDDVEPSKRADWLDVSKGVAILFVITVHSIIPKINAITTHLSSFTISIFFVLAGLTYNSNRHRYKLRSFAVSRGRQFLIPYFGLYLVMIALFYLLPSIVDTYLTPELLLFSLFYGSGPPGQSTHLWFLPVLYFGMLLFAVLDRLFAKAPHVTRFSLLILLPLLAFGINSIFSPNLVPWHLGSILIAATFVMIGNEMRNVHSVNVWTMESKSKNMILIILGVITLVVLSDINGFTDIAIDNLGNSVWLYMINGTLGTALVFAISSQIAVLSASMRKLQILLGNASQEIYEAHPFTFLLVPSILLVLGWTAADIDAAYDILWPLRFLLGVIVSTLLVLFVIRKNRALSLLFTGSYKRMEPKE